MIEMALLVSLISLGCVISLNQLGTDIKCQLARITHRIGPETASADPAFQQLVDQCISIEQGVIPPPLLIVGG